MNYAIEFKNVSKKFKNSKELAVNNVNLNIEKGSFVVLLGSSGSGKTTLLKMINGLYIKNEGEIYINGKEINSLNRTSLRRKIGYVIQQNGLFPHMNVYQNIATVPKIFKWSKDEIDIRINNLLQLVDLPDEYKHKYPNELSGGQQQRVGIARALAGNPSILLMDEPFASLDALTRTNLQDELLRIQKQQKKTILFVSHDIGEAIKLADKIVIMNNGKIIQYDTPYNIIKNPADTFVLNLIYAFKSFTEPFSNIYYNKV
ncbi:ABC transporter ATP-binding protein [Clostridium aestuarii]|uniref:ABC transporter ATP-binding protein n=1 Tax=Clostridium aestuarii TaxID=338193 RepID=A0ABT4D0E8_9CLOT|nr:ABC transporter ATP-binding protein [Clostridium aestuarii]MCY6484572.1 ABC transporter ATP-binding protein [Clostridium aestuarii]